MNALVETLNNNPNKTEKRFSEIIFEFEEIWQLESYKITVFFIIHKHIITIT